MYKAVVFDRDGTLNVTGTNEGGYILTPEDVRLLPGAAEAVQRVWAAGAKVFVFTQQGCIGKGLLSEAGLAAIHRRLEALLAPSGGIVQFYHCPHTAEAGCSCRKPAPGMLLQLMRDHGLAPHEVLVIGDHVRDGAAAQAAGMDFAFVQQEKKTLLQDKTAYPVVYENVLAAVKAAFE